MEEIGHVAVDLLQVSKKSTVGEILRNNEVTKRPQWKKKATLGTSEVGGDHKYLP